MILLPIILLSLLLFRNSFSIYFFQDDWFSFSISKIRTLNDFLHFFIPRADVQFYRPLSVETFYFLGRQLFGLNPVGFHILVWVFFTANIFLVWKLSKKFIDNWKIQLVITLFYATSAIHYSSLYWLANFSYILVGFWYFLGFWLFLKSNNSIGNNILLVTVFLFGLLSNEFMITFPTMTVIHTVILDRKKIKKIIPLFLTLFFISCFYLVIRFFIFKPNISSYQPVFDKSIISSFRFFILYFLNFPETIKDQMVSFYKVNPAFLQAFSRDFYIMSTNLLVSAFAFIILPIIVYFKNKSYRFYISKNYNRIIFAVLWFIVTLIPVIFFPSHIYPHYGVISLFGLLMLFMILLNGYKKLLGSYKYRFVLFILVVSWIISSLTTISLNEKIHWIKWRSDKARMWTQRAKSAFPTVPSKSLIQMPTEDNEDKVALADDLAIKIIYGNDNLDVLFSTASSKLKGIMVVP